MNSNYEICIHSICLNYTTYRNKLPPYFENLIPHYGAYHQNLRNNHIRLPAGCQFEKIIRNIKMHFRLRELASPSNPLPGAPNSTKFRGGCRGPANIRQRGGCNKFFNCLRYKNINSYSFYAKRLKKVYF